MVSGIILSTLAAGPLGVWGGLDPAARKLSTKGFRGPKEHRNIRISHAGSRAQWKGDTRNHGW